MFYNIAFHANSGAVGATPSAGAVVDKDDITFLAGTQVAWSTNRNEAFGSTESSWTNTDHWVQAWSPQPSPPISGQGGAVALTTFRHRGADVTASKYNIDFGSAKAIGAITIGNWSSRTANNSLSFRATCKIGSGSTWGGATWVEYHLAYDGSTKSLETSSPFNANKTTPTTFNLVTTLNS